jgi:hypothetical protein
VIRQNKKSPKRCATKIKRLQIAHHQMSVRIGLTSKRKEKMWIGSDSIEKLKHDFCPVKKPLH